MKKIILLSLIILNFSYIYAQNSKGKSDDAGRITLAAVVATDIDGLTPSAQKFLKNKLNQITSKNGMGGSAVNERFIITANVQIVTKDITPTAPPMHAYGLEVTFYVGDGIEGKLFSSTSMNLKGVGTTPTKAYKMALKNIRTTDTRFKGLIEQGKTKIIEYYNSQCDLLLKEADMLVSQNEYELAIKKLIEVPEVCKECYDKAMNAVGPVYQKQIDRECKSLLIKAKSAWSEGQDANAAQNASIFLGKIDPNASCFGDVQTLTQSMAKRIKELDQREWDFKLKQQQDNVDIQKATISAARDIGVAAAKNQPKTVVYNFRGWY
ncbi:hypothetical protein OAP07_05730 [Bacteroidia bacterium]|jgi:hypothetical protein|nr:hypothetical protein [Bacteroidia bacterium]MDC0561558.1 hypothetical protein [Bacteroidia bacterium]